MSDNKGSQTELESLFVDESGEEAIDTVLRTVLEQFVGFTRDGKIVTRQSFLKLSDPTRILVALLARRAMVRLNIPGAKQEAGADQLAAECLVPLKSCREHLSRYKSRRLLEKNLTGYFVPAWAVPDAAAAVLKKPYIQA
jgi:hypothetical protein